MEGLILAHSLSAHSLSRWGRYGGRSMRRCVCYQEVEMNTDDQLIFSFLFSLGPQPMGWCHPHQDWSSLFSQASLETLSQATP